MKAETIQGGFVANDPKVVVPILERENHHLREALQKQEHTTEGWKLRFWLSLAMSGVLLLVIAELKGCISHRGGTEMELPY